jgi:Kdo2-lipid IVA lauroyltransferase/acyltransferase
MSNIAAVKTEAAADSRRPSVGDRVEYALLRIAFGLGRAIPPRWGLKVGAGLGLLFYLLDIRDRRIALINLRLAFPDYSASQRRGILRAACRNLGRMAFEVAQLPTLTPEALSRHVTIADRDRWDRVLARARDTGAIILTGHYGNWELLAYACGLMGQPVTLIHRPMRNRLVDAQIAALRSRAGTRAIPKKAAAKEALRRLRAKQLLAIPVDQNQVHSFGVFVDFFGVPACTTTGPARLAALTGAPIVPVFLVRDGASERHRIVFLPDIELASTGDRDADVRTNTQRCTAVFEQMVREHPDHWIWFHKRWKTRPPGEPRMY